MTESEAIAYIEDYSWSASRMGLERSRALLAALGQPQRKLRFVHVTGSNGKGSTCAMLDAVLRQAGYRTGLYTSPYIQSFNERIRVNGENIPGPALAAITGRVRAIADAMDDHPSQFELVTAIAMEYFAETGCEIVVLEVGMGGALDSTNAIDAPELAVLTNIGLEHTEYLGDTLAKIAATKAGIIKPGCACVCYDGAGEALEVIREVCAGMGVPLYRADFSRLRALSCSLDGQDFLYRGQRFRLSLLGPFQLRNAAVALEAVAALRLRGWAIDDGALRRGLASACWPARMEILSREPLFILDGGHNPQCAEALRDSLETLLPGERPVFLLGVLADKDWHGMLELLRPLASRFICVTPLSPRALPGEKLAEYLESRGCPAVCCPDIGAGVRAALAAAGERGAVVAFGSLYLAGALRTEFAGVFRGWLRREKIRAREALSPAEREARSAEICRRVLRSEEYRRAETVLLYRAVRGEVRLDVLEAAAKADGKRLAYPLCVSRTELEAMEPEGDGAWRRGSFGIEEPLPGSSRPVLPEEIDLVLCPCTAFDGAGVRLGMGGGYYDRYLPRCTRARVAAAAFDCQRAARLPAEPWDRGMDMIFTESSAFSPETVSRGEKHGD